MDNELYEYIVEDSVLNYQQTFDLKQICFDKQYEFISDLHRLKALFCTRRAAKSYTGGLYLVYEALSFHACNCLYVGLTRLSAKGIIWKDVLKDINTRNNLQMQFNGSELTATTRNGSVIYVTGADADNEEMEKLLGKKYRLVIIDEAASFSVDLRRLCYGILKPATADHRGTICLLGTSGNLTAGLFFDITTGKEDGWKLFKWTAYDNPYVATQWKEEIEDIKLNRPLFMETSLFKQWYLNEWVIDSDKLVYRFAYNRNEFSSLPVFRGGLWTYVLGVDLGYDPDPSAFVLVCFHQNDSILYVIDCYKKTEMDITDVANKIKEFKSLYDIERVVIDGANKQAVMEIQKRHNIGLTTADKTGKADFIQIMNAEFIQGKIKISSSCQDLKEEYLKLIWDENSLKKQESPSCANHLCFIAGTMIKTSNGDIPIEDLKVGDLVETRNGLRPIQYTINRRSEVITLHLSNGSKITCTPDHPFWSDNKWIKAQSLTQTDFLLDWKTQKSHPAKPAVYVVHSSIGITDNVYNITVEQDHEYFANDILVSNCDASLYAWRYCYQFLSQAEKKIPNLRNKDEYIKHTQSLMEEYLEKQIQSDKNKEEHNDMWNIEALDDQQDVLSYYLNKRKN